MAVYATWFVWLVYISPSSWGCRGGLCETTFSIRGLKHFIAISADTCRHQQVLIAQTHFSGDTHLCTHAHESGGIWTRTETGALLRDTAVPSPDPGCFFTLIRIFQTSFRPDLLNQHFLHCCLLDGLVCPPVGIHSQILYSCGPVPKPILKQHEGG